MSTTILQRRRRWFAFSLRTLFILLTIVAVALGYLAWQMRIVRERKSLLAEIDRLERQTPFFSTHYIGLETVEVSDPAMLPPEGFEYQRISWLRRLLGDESCLFLYLQPELGSELIERAELAFPEAVLASEDPDDKSEQLRDSLYRPSPMRVKNRGTLFKTGLK